MSVHINYQKVLSSTLKCNFRKKWVWKCNSLHCRLILLCYTRSTGQSDFLHTSLKLPKDPKVWNKAVPHLWHCRRTLEFMLSGNGNKLKKRIRRASREKQKLLVTWPTPQHNVSNSTKTNYKEQIENTQLSRLFCIPRIPKQSNSNILPLK